jgi:hypothetical protein
LKTKVLRFGNRRAAPQGMEAIVITTTMAGALGFAYAIQRMALNLLLRAMAAQTRE